MTPVGALGILALLFGGCLAVYYESQARRRLSPQGESRPLRIYFLGRWLGPEEFTPEGWRYHKRSLLVGLLTILIAIPLLMLGRP